MLGSFIFLTITKSTNAVINSAGYQNNKIIKINPKKSHLIRQVISMLKKVAIKSNRRRRPSNTSEGINAN